jgi:hypothetical protein
MKIISNTKTLSPNGLSTWVTSQNVWLSVLNANLWIIGVSFQIKNLTTRIINQAFLLFCKILHVKNSFNLSEILNQLYAVLLPIIKRAAIPDDEDPEKY